MFRRGMTRAEHREGLRLIEYGGWMEEGGMSANGTPWMAECETLDDTPAVQARDQEVRETLVYFTGPHPSQDRWLPSEWKQVKLPADPVGWRVRRG